MRRISAAPQSRPWSARRDGIARSACQEGRRYRLRRRAIDSAPVSSLVTGKASHSYELGTPHSITSSARVSNVGRL